MRTRVLLAAGALCAAVPLLSAPGAARASGSYPTVPKATCGAGSLPETGLQGEVPLADQLDGRSTQGYRCNLELTGQYRGDGAGLMLAWYGHCAYMPTGYSSTDPDYAAKKGVVVIDASDTAHPVETERLQSDAMINPWEALKVSQATGVLATGEGGSFPLAGPGASGPVFDDYDVKGDCAHPKLDASVTLADGKGHEGDFSPDGKTYYQSSLAAPPATSVVAVDVSDPTKPKEVGAYAIPLGATHAVQIGEGGNRGYFMVAGFQGSPQLGNDGLVIADTSDIQARKPNPQLRIIGKVFWTDGAEAQIGRFVRIGGRPYVITTDEFGAQANPADACAMGQNPYGFVHIVDVGDETAPKLVNTIRLEINDPANCSTTQPEQNAALALMYSSHYCTPDDPENTTAIACSWISSGLRVFDVRDVLHPREIAYYNPPAVTDVNSLRGSAPISEALVGTTTKDSTASQVRWFTDPVTGQKQLWTISTENGFQILHFTNGAYPLPALPASTAPSAPVSSAPAALPTTVITIPSTAKSTRPATPVGRPIAPAPIVLTTLGPMTTGASADRPSQGGATLAFTGLPAWVSLGGVSAALAGGLIARRRRRRVSP